LAGYKVVISVSAEEDILSILRYISVTLREPSAAKRIYSSVKDKITSLRYMPDRHSVVCEEPFTEMGIRELFVENYTVFYKIDEEAKTVQVIRVLYNRREWQRIIE
jgi:toxin ParE1/3/4